MRVTKSDVSYHNTRQAQACSGTNKVADSSSYAKAMLTSAQEKCLTLASLEIDFTHKEQCQHALSTFRATALYASRLVTMASKPDQARM